MPSYDDQLAAYRSQLANISSMQAQTAASAPGTGPMATAGLAFNTMMGDMSRMASYVSTFTSTPAYSSIPLSGGNPYNMGFGQAVGALAGFTNPATPMYVADYQYRANERIARGVGASSTGLITGAMEMGGGILGGMALGAAGGAIGGSIVPGFGTAVGGIVGGLVGGFVGAAAMTPFGAPAVQIAQASQQLQLSTPAIFGGMGMTRDMTRGLARDLSRQAIGRSDDWIASPAEEMNLSKMIVNQGTKFGLFAGTTDTASFSKELGELTTTIKEMSRAIRVSKEEMVPILAEMRQGGFYGAQAGGQAIMQGSGLAYGAGVGFGEMHEMGLRGAAMFRGTGMPTRMGYNAGQQGLFNVRSMMRTGALSAESVNQLGGVTGAAESLVAGQAGFAQGPYGRYMTAAFMSGNGGVNEGAVSSFLQGGGDIYSFAASANVDQTALANPANVQKFRAAMGDRMQLVQAKMLGDMVGTYQGMGIGRENAEGMAFTQFARGMGIDPTAANQELYINQSRDLPKLMREQHSNLINERRRLANDRSDREYDLAGQLEIRDTARQIRRGIQPFSEAISRAGDWVSDASRDIGDFVSGRRRVTGGNLDRAYEIVKGEGFKGMEGMTRTGGVLSEDDYQTAYAMGFMKTKVEGPNKYTYDRPGVFQSPMAEMGWVMDKATGSRWKGLGAEIGTQLSEADYRRVYEGVQSTKEALSFDLKKAGAETAEMKDYLDQHGMSSSLANQIVDASTSSSGRDRGAARAGLITEIRKLQAQWTGPESQKRELTARWLARRGDVSSATEELVSGSSGSFALMSNTVLQKNIELSKPGWDKFFGTKLSEKGKGDIDVLDAQIEWFETGTGSGKAERVMKEKGEKDYKGIMSDLEAKFTNPAQRKEALDRLKFQRSISANQQFIKGITEGDAHYALVDFSGTVMLDAAKDGKFSDLSKHLENATKGKGELKKEFEDINSIVHGMKEEDLKEVSKTTREMVMSVKEAGSIENFLRTQSGQQKEGETESRSSSARAQANTSGYRRAPGTNEYTETIGSLLNSSRALADKVEQLMKKEK